MRDRGGAALAALTGAESTQVMLVAERSRWRDAFVAQIRATLPGVRIVGAGADRLWNTVSLSMPHGENHRWVAKLDKRGFQVSTGSACAASQNGPSHVLAGQPPTQTSAAAAPGQPPSDTADR